MPKTSYYTATTLDGYIADADNSLQWLFEADSGDNSEFADFFASVGAFAMGRTTWEWVIDHEDLRADPGKWHGYYGDVPAWVFSNRPLEPVPGVDARFVRGDVRPVHAEMTAAAAGKDIWLVGGGELVGQFADAGLLDELIVGVAPVTLGGGAPLLPRRLESSRLTLTGVRQVHQFAYLTYAVS
ncbi:dihydrofolate reductase family protein [Actinoplanes sp. NPDC089786]|uniref:dihydrofolate reductase family protein n=1 Tax=Actinoplanes sp. NPDC089786 TaxID=3155185 RepID=UPI0034137D16